MTSTTKRRKILIVDDDAILVLTLKRRLRTAGYEAVYALYALAAIDAAVSERPDLVVLDLGMARRNGYWVLQQLKALPKSATTPVIVLTGWGADDNQRRSFKAGAADFLQKPTDENELLASIERALGKPSSEPKAA